jgi:hypothetical protein
LKDDTQSPTMVERGDRDPGARPPLDAGATTHLPTRHASVPFRTFPSAEPEPESLPNRYEIRDVEDRRLLVCREAPGVGVAIDPGHAFSEVEARKLGERTVLLDGAGTFGPLIDDTRNLYNLDHHEGCLRAFTLATCEQALLMVLKGLELDKGDWTVYANQPDLDTVLAIWVLLNYRRVRDLDARARDSILPLLRLEGAIDANGFEIAEYCGLPQDRVAEEKARLDRLFERELAAKNQSWEGVDLVGYTLDMLLEIDTMVYTSGDFSDYASVEQEYGHVAVGGDKVAVVCRDSSGIYEVEKRLKKVWGDRLGLIALERAPGQYTLRLSAALSGIVLEDAYERLNLLDPAVDGRPAEKRWGGSDDIGGSPRPQGTGLTAREIGKILKLTYQPARPWYRLKRFATAALWTLILAAASGLGVVMRRLLLEVPEPEVVPAVDLMVLSAVSGVGAWLLTYRLSRGWTWLFGWRRPAGEDYLALVPAVLLGAAAGGVWVPPEISWTAEPLAMAAGAMILTALSLSLWFPGLAHGLLVLEAKIQTVGGPWFVSRPAWFVGALYAVVTWTASYFGVVAGQPWALAAPWEGLTVAFGALLAGVALAMMRERSLSIWPAVGSLAVGCVVRILIDVVRGVG